uniref:Uncharacterized protein n=1 Tax=Arundo donax TaxID=35708 RepID=A0A0A9C3Y9_ARUDO
MVLEVKVINGTLCLLFQIQQRPKLAHMDAAPNDADVSSSLLAVEHPTIMTSICVSARCK